MSIWESRSAAFGVLTRVGQGLKAVLSLVSALPLQPELELRGGVHRKPGWANRGQLDPRF